MCSHFSSSLYLCRQSRYQNTKSTFQPRDVSYRNALAYNSSARSTLVSFSKVQNTGVFEKLINYFFIGNLIFLSSVLKIETVDYIFASFLRNVNRYAPQIVENFEVYGAPICLGKYF